MSKVQVKLVICQKLFPVPRNKICVYTRLLILVTFRIFKSIPKNISSELNKFSNFQNKLKLVNFLPYFAYQKLPFKDNIVCN
jgi:hypothetical protein